MKSDIVTITKQGKGFDQALEETRKVAVYKGLKEKDTMHLILFTEEMISLVRSMSADTVAEFWIECADKTFDLHLSADMILDRQERARLIDTATSRRNEAAKSFLGRIRDSFEQAMATDVQPDNLPQEIVADMVNRNIEEPETDAFECSILHRLADIVKISIQGRKVDMTVRKTFRA